MDQAATALLRRRSNAASKKTCDNAGIPALDLNQLKP
jgi:hypothetical protein